MSNAYPILLALGVVTALVWLGAERSASGRGQAIAQAHRRIDVGTIAVLTGLAGGRLAYVIDRWSYFRSFPQEVFWVWDGGLSWIGGVAGVLLGIAIYAGIRRENYLSLLDTLSLPAIFIGFVSWFGCLIDRCGYGREANFGFLTPPASNIFGVYANRFPVQAMGAIIYLIFLLYLYNLQQKNLPPGILASTALLLISLANFALSFFRGDAVRIVSGIRIDAIAALPLILIGALALMILTRKRLPQTEK
jgi:phosphatidylglycerol:prolipoprotein diacylglycerol transferase